MLRLVINILTDRADRTAPVCVKGADMKEVELRPCPFCGGKAIIHVSDGVRVICRECGVMTKCLCDGITQGKPTGSAIGSVVDAWNRRA